MAYEYFYPGTAYSLDPNYGDSFSGYRMSSVNLGMATDPRTANQLQEIAIKVNPGAKSMEVGAVSADVFDSIPRQHMKELNRLATLTGVDLSVHAPLVEPSGYTKEGWEEAARRQSEVQMFSAVERSHELNPKGNIPVTFHSSAMLPEAEEKMKEKVEGVYKEIPKAVYMVDPRTGEIGQIKEKEQFFPREKIPQNMIEKYKLSQKEVEDIQTGKRLLPELEIQKRNDEMWIQNLNQMNYYAVMGEERLDRIMQIPEEALKKQGIVDQAKIEEKQNQFIKALSEMKPEKIPEELRDSYSDVSRGIDHANIFLRDSYNMLRELYNRVYKNASDEEKKALDKYANKITPSVREGIEKDPRKLKEFSGIIEEGIRVLKDMEHPKLFVPLNDFLIDKSSETFANVAFKSYDKFGKDSPIISIENPPVGGALSRAEDLKKLIEASREKFIKKAKEEGMSASEAKSASEKLIGATWDVGHINMIRKYGYDKVDVVKEAEKIKPFVKHVHLSDNFGLEHTELPMGMGNVPIKEIMEKLGKEGFEAKKVVEAGNWWQHFKTSPFTQSLEAFGSPLYAMKAPYWNQMPAYGNYMAFPSAYFPEQHFSLYGGGFAAIPMELGGQMPGKQSRTTGTAID